MSKRLVKRIVIWTCSILIVMGISGYFVMNYAVNRVLFAMAGENSSQKPMVTLQPIPTVAPTPEKVEPTPIPLPETVLPSPSIDLPPIVTQTPLPLRSAIKAPTATPNGTTITEVTPTPQTVTIPDKPVVVESVSPTPDVSVKYDGNVTPEKAEKAKEQITLQEKTMISTIFLKRLNADDIKLLMGLAGSGGMTTDEKLVAKKVILQKLSEDEYNQMIFIAAKLGLSQGRDYKETSKDYEVKP